MEKTYKVEITDIDLHTIYEMSKICFDVCKKANQSNFSDKENLGTFIDNASNLLERLNKQLEEIK